MNLRELVSDFAGDAFGSGAVQVAVKTNLGPELPIGQGSGLADALGIKAAVIVRDRQGRVVYTHGTPPETNPVLVGVLGAAVALAGFLLVRGLVKR